VVELDISVSEGKLETTGCLLRLLAGRAEAINLLEYPEVLRSIVAYSAKKPDESFDCWVAKATVELA